MRFMIIFLLLFSTGSAKSQFRTHVYDERILYVDLPYGKVEISRVTVGDNFGFWAQAHGTIEITLESALMPYWIETYENSALLRLDMGTAGCRTMYAWITYDKDGLRTSGSFGTCAYDGVYEVGPNGPSYTMENNIKGDPTISYVLDQKTGQVSNASAPWE